MPIPQTVVPGDTIYPPIGQALDFTAAGDTTLVPARPGFKVKVWRLFGTFSAATNVTIKSGSTPLTGDMEMTQAGSSISFPIEAAPHFVTAIGEALVFNMSNAVNFSGGMAYTYEPQ